MSGLVANRGERIKELRDEFVRYGMSTRSSVDMATVVDLQNLRGARQYRLSVLKRRKKSAVVDRTRIEAELRGYRKALTLYEGSSSGNGPGRSEMRLLGRLDVRIAEAEDRSHEIDELERAMRDVESQLRSVEEQLVDALQECVAGASNRHAVHTAGVRRRARLEGGTLPEDVESMWSPTPVLGYRVWSLKGDGFYGAWERWTESTYTATCRSAGDVPHTDGTCNDIAFGCGVYAAKDMARLLGSTNLTLKQNFAAGLVALEGKVVEHQRGYRAEKATVVSLMIVHDGVMSIVDDPEELRGVFVDPWERDTEEGALPPISSDGVMRRTIVEELKKREEGHTTWT